MTRYTIRLLIVEDSEDDAAIAVRMLMRDGIDARYERVETAATMRAALRRERWDAVISDFEMPHFNGLEALAVLRDAGLDTPFILVSGAIGEETAAELMKAGANDYVLKKNLARLAPALRRELAEAANRAAQRASERALADSEARLRAIIANEPECVKLVARDGALVDMNPAGLAMLEASSVEEVRERTLLDFVAPEHRSSFVALHQRVIGGEPGHLEFDVVGMRGTRRRLETHAAPLRAANDEVMLLGITHDVTEQRRAEERLRASESLKSAILESSLDCIVAMDDEGRIVEFNPAAETTFGYRRDHALGRRLDELIVLPELRSMLGRRVEVKAMRADGSTFPAEVAVTQVRHGSAALFTGFIRDITERREAEAKIRRLNRVYSVLGGINGAIVRIRDRGELLQEACRIAIDAGGFRMAWIGFLDRSSELVRPVTAAGAVGDFFARAPLAVTEARPDGHGLAGRAVRERRPMISNDVASDPQRLMKKECAERGINSLAVLPVMVGGEATGVFALYAADSGFFDAEETQLLEELAGDIGFAIEHIEKSEKVDYLAYYDALTGLANRNLLHERLADELRALGAERRCALLVLNVDRFKDINDAYGRQSGDRVLRKVAQRLVDELGDAGRVARAGADTFAILVPEPASEEATARLAANLISRVFDRPIRVGDGELRVAGRLGIAMYPADARDGDALFQRAEAAMKKAKTLGEKYLFYTHAMTERIAEKLALESRLRRALEREELVLHYQPTVSSETGALAGMEALIRWQSPELGLVPPMEFVPLMEQTGLILEAGAWALRRAALDHRAWSERGLAPPRIAVNVSAIQLRQADFVERVERAIREGVSPAGIDLEITESLVMQDVAMSSEKLARVRALGVNVAIDDFGTGYSSLAYLARLPVQTLKIDRSFIITMLQDANTMALVRTIISLAGALRLRVVAEGVDSDEQAKVLRLLRCDQMQGYLFSRPVPFDAMTALLERATVDAGG